MGEGNGGAWPTTADGTTDWERVFEDPGNGLIAIVCRSDTAAQLRAMTLIVLKNLFKRKNDDGVEDKLAAMVDRTVAVDARDTSINELRANVTALLRRIKNDRIERAAAYVVKRQSAPAPDSPATDSERRAAGVETGLPEGA